MGRGLGRGTLSPCKGVVGCHPQNIFNNRVCKYTVFGLFSGLGSDVLHIIFVFYILSLVFFNFKLCHYIVIIITCILRFKIINCHVELNSKQL